MKLYHKKNLSIAGLATALTVAAPFSIVSIHAQQDRTTEQRGQTEAQQGWTSGQSGRADAQQRSTTGARSDSTFQSFDNTKASSDIIGMDVHTQSGEKFGQIGDIFIDVKTGKVMAVLVNTGSGRMGSGGPRYLLSADDLTLDNEKENLRTELSEEQLISAPRYRQLDTSEFDNVRSMSSGTSSSMQRQPGSTGSAPRSTGSEQSSRSTDQMDPENVRSTSDDASTRTQRQVGSRRVDSRLAEDDQTSSSPDQRDARTSSSPDQRDARTSSSPDQRDASSTRSSSEQASTTQRQVGNRQADSTGTSGQQQSVPAAQRVAVSDLLGMNIENLDGDKVGSVDELYLDLDSSQIIGAVVSTGGFLGMGTHQNVLALSELDYNADEDKFRVDMNREELRSAPTYKANDDSWHAGFMERFNQGNDQTGMQSADRPGTASRTGATQQAGATDRTGTTQRADRSDRSAENRPTVFNQGNSSAETKMTADIRKEIRSNNDMSSRAQNVTIITQGENVLLRGNVDSASEKSQIEDIAEKIAGNDNVTSELVVQSR